MFEEFIGVNFWTALFTLLNTLAVFFCGKKILFGPISQMIQDRQQEIDNLYADANAARAQALALEAQYQQKLSVAQETSDQIIRDATQRAQHRESEILRQANLEASAMLDKAAADIQLEKKKALNEVKDQITDLAMDIAGKVVGRTVTEADRAALVDSFIDELGGAV